MLWFCTLALPLFSFEIWASNPPSTFHCLFVNFSLPIFSTNSIVSLTILGLPSRFCALMFLHPTFLRSSFLAFSCLRQSSRKCCKYLGGDPVQVVIPYTPNR